MLSAPAIVPRHNNQLLPGEFLYPSREIMTERLVDAASLLARDEEWPQ